MQLYYGLTTVGGTYSVNSVPCTQSTSATAEQFPLSKEPRIFLSTTGSRLYLVINIHSRGKPPPVHRQPQRSEERESDSRYLQSNSPHALAEDIRLSESNFTGRLIIANSKLPIVLMHGLKVQPFH
jgi:hypothetical protein